MKKSFHPIIGQNSKVLILGTMPGDKSLRTGEYYSNPSNQFWAILSSIFNEQVGTSYDEKIKFLKNKRIALWDVLASCERKGSTDKNIRNALPNDFHNLFELYNNLSLVVFNGSKAEKYFYRYVLKNLQIREIKYIQLPSTSSSPGRYVKSLDQKILEWKVIVELIF